jgi:hypothetical protein
MGVKTVRGLPQITLQEAVIPLEHLQSLVSGDPHNRQVINTRSSHIGHGRMPEVMEAEPFNLGPPARCVEGRLNGVD